MIKKIVKFSLILSAIFGFAVIYLSSIGLQTSKFNQLIKNEISKNNKKFEIDLNAIKIILNLSNFSINVKVVDLVLIYNGNRVRLNRTESNLSISSLINKNFAITNLLISTKDVKLKQIISIVGSYKNSMELFILEKIVKEGELIADIDINFNEKGEIKDDYSIRGFVKNARLELLDKKKIKSLNFNFQLKNKEYLLEDIKTEFSEIKLFSKSIKIKNTDKGIYINGFFKNTQSDLKPEILKIIFANYYKDIDNLNFSSDNEFSFNINKKFKVKDIQVLSKIKLNKLNYRVNASIVKGYIPNFKETIKLKDHSIKLLLKKNELNLSGKGNFLIENESDILEYKFVRKNNDLFFNSKIIFEKNPLIINFLKYEKKNNVKSSLELKGLYKKKHLKFDKILLKENKNEFLIEGLILSEKLKINEIKKIKINFLNKDKINNKITLERNENNYDINGEIFDADILLNTMFEGDDDESLSKILDNFNSTIKIKINKTYLDKVSYLNNINAKITFKKSDIVSLDLVSEFSNKKKLKLTINTNEDNEKITTLFSGNAKPIVQKYKFIKGFEEGSLDFYSIKKNSISSSKLKIYDFKLNELPALTKILTLASLQGIADLLTGEGIRFNDFEMSFSNKGKLMTIQEIYAIGPAISILMEGYVESKKLVSLKGTLVPATTVNKFISSIPLFGNILVGKKVGEGVFGVSFKIKGPPKDLKTTVNPIKTLTPRFIIRTLEKIQKN